MERQTCQGHSSCLGQLPKLRKITALNWDVYFPSELPLERCPIGSSPKDRQAHRDVAGKAESRLRFPVSQESQKITFPPNKELSIRITWISQLQP
jgi:hypothetical protein